MTVERVAQVPPGIEFDPRLTVAAEVLTVTEYAVYLLSSKSRRLYVGVTSDLRRRICEHRNGRVPGFTARYRINRLVYYEQTANIRAAIEREKEIKRWSRAKKVSLIESVNLGWIDLAEDWV